eukprot:353419-Chlamydomonas_euryale.AAC.1
MRRTVLKTGASRGVLCLERQQSGSKTRSTVLRTGARQGVLCLEREQDEEFRGGRRGGSGGGCRARRRVRMALHPHCTSDPH